MQNKGKGYITAEKKILVILLYYIVLVFIGLFPFTPSGNKGANTKDSAGLFYLWERQKQPL